VRTGTSASAVNVAETVAALHAAGAAAVTVHGRTAEQRYRRPADWGAVAAVAAAGSGPVIGNGDILTHYEARRAPRTCSAASTRSALPQAGWKAGNGCTSAGAGTAHDRGGRCAGGWQIVSTGR
jgi:hypothetical protein